MSVEHLTKEQRILRVMRKVLASVVKDTTTPPGYEHPLSEQTVQDIKECFGLISARERELAEEAGIVQMHKPMYPGETSSTKVVQIHKNKKDEGN